MAPYKKLILDQSFVAGEWQADLKSAIEVTNPANGEVISKIRASGVKMLEKATQAAYNSFEEWRSRTARERQKVLQTWYEQIILHKEEIATIMTLESGKPLAESRGEVEYGASFIQWFAEEGKRVYGDTIPAFSSDRRIVVIRQPVGVVAAMTPWNFPLAMITRKVAPALAVGCPVVVRPSNETPLTALAITKLAEASGFPAGVFNVVVSKDAAVSGKFLCEHEKISKISFTGSTKVGQLLVEQSASTLKKLSLELGGNAPFIVFEDADIDAAVKGAIASKFRNAGQTCVCVNRFIVHESVYDEFTDKFSDRVRKLKIGNGLGKGVEVGPLISGKAVETMKSFVEDAKAKGGKVLCGGVVLEGQFFSPTVIGDSTADMKFATEEIFGPIAPVFKFSTDEEAIRMANDTIYGLAAYMYWTRLCQASP